MEIYLVGGAVRDELLGLPVKERDWVVVDASPEDMLAKGFKPVGKDFPVFLHPDTNEEYALARTERKSGHGYKGFTFHTGSDVTLEMDLQRRDLTINAIAKSADGTIIDPFNGREDLQNGLLRHVSPAFQEDPVRVLRVARFAARFAKYGFKVAHATNALMREMAQSGELDHLVPERVWKELENALGETDPQRFFRILIGCNAFSAIFPELSAYSDISTGHSNDDDFHLGDLALQALTNVANLSPEPAIRLATYCFHPSRADSVKTLSSPTDETLAQNALSIKNLTSRVKTPKATQQLCMLVTRHYASLLRFDELTPEQQHELLCKLDIFRRTERIDQLTLVINAILPALTSNEAIKMESFRNIASAIIDIRLEENEYHENSGSQIAELLRKKRIERLKKFKN